MRTRLFALFLLLSSVSLVSCQQDSTDDVRPATEILQDSWTWQQSSGGFTGQVLTPAGTGDQQQLEFGPDGQVRRYRNGRLLGTDSYTVRRGTSVIDGQTAFIIRYGSGLAQSALVGGSHLTLRDEVADGQQHEYNR
ncbi:hypothetical protein F0P96_12815 [Hymenobacter busanensis]|uniref:Uncharacterized protein n=1 Tax=Hymenobacter busanensis TaxID=2607656 RepID=A0A7L4ZVR5_9BACT|nr:hypothetical protein [Hymenobacter busanensis]KAA9332352.1 hypothetical protein F0P96_12815 [Hymenobacter busanensis]QHJ07311.1 hypothetical protein GUY19_08460 [Hymenobacter busanensis]